MPAPRTTAGTAPPPRGSDGRTRGPYLRGELGRYGWPMQTSVTVFWEFDAESKLARTRLRQTVDTP